MNEENNNGFLDVGGNNTEPLTPVRDSILKPPTIREEEQPAFVSPTPEINNSSSPFGLAPPVNNASMGDNNNNFTPIGLSEGQTLSSIAKEHRAARVEGPIDENHDGVADEEKKEEEPTEEEIEKSLEKKYVKRPQHVRKRKGISSIFVFLFFGLAIAGGVWYVYTYNPFGDNLEGEPTKSNNQIEIFRGGVDTISGTYKNENGTIGICNAGSYAYVSITHNDKDPIEIYGTIKESKFESHNGEIDYTISIDDDEIKLDTNNTDLIGGTFKVEDKLDIDECYETYNDVELSKNKATGLYTSNNGKVLINVIDKDNIMVALYNDDHRLINNVTLGETEVIDDIKNLNIRVDDKIVFNAEGFELLSEDESIKGSYKKLEKVNTKDLINFYGEFNNNN